jgi:hypothetical protein
MRIICKLEKRALVRIICEFEKRAVDGDYLQVGEEGPGCGLFASWRRGPWIRILQVGEECPGADYLKVGKEGPQCRLLESGRRGSWMRIICELKKRALNADNLQNIERAMNAELLEGKVD